jgi:putative tricarboxylic transport membrane protein
MELLAASFEIILRWDVIAALLIGAIGGVIVGGLPGVGAAVAIAIALPLTFSMEPIIGLTLLLGIYGSSMFGGAIPAILVNTPGTPVNALTTYDGYPMTKRGEARRALSLAYSASFFGAVFSICALMLLAPVLDKVAPMFGAREIFLAALLGILLVVITHRGQVLAAAMLACFGIFLSTIGIEATAYNPALHLQAELAAIGRGPDRRGAWPLRGQPSAGAVYGQGQKLQAAPCREGGLHRPDEGSLGL